MSITKTKSGARAATDIEKATILMQQYRALHLQQQSLQTQKKEIEAQLYQLSEKNKSWFERSKTLNLDVYGKVSYVNETAVVYDLESYNEDRFAYFYPKCFERKIKVSAIKGLCMGDDDVCADIESFGVRLGSQEKFTVTTNK